MEFPALAAQEKTVPEPTLRVHWKTNNVAIDKSTEERLGFVEQKGRRDWFAESPFFENGKRTGPYRTRRLARKWVEEKAHEFRAKTYLPPELPADREPRRAPHVLNSKPDSLDPDVVADLRQRGGKWAVYENKELGSPKAGQLVCLRYGEGCTFTIPPDKAPAFRCWKRFKSVKFSSRSKLASLSSPMTPRSSAYSRRFWITLRSS